MTQKPEPETEIGVSPGVLKLGGGMIMLLGLLIVIFGFKLVFWVWLGLLAGACLFAAFLVVWYWLKYGKWIWRQ